MPNIENVENVEQVTRNNPVVGLFGTCGGSKWRDNFIQRYEQEGIYYFNPNKEDWHPEDAIIEAEHLKNDEIILFPVTGETYGTGSLSEVGFSIMQAIDQNRGAKIVVMIEKDLDESLDDPIARKESSRSRAIIMEHLKKIEAKNVYVVDDLETMLEVSVGLYSVCKAEKKIQSVIEKRREEKENKENEQKGEVSAPQGKNTNDSSDGHEDPE